MRSLTGRWGEEGRGGRLCNLACHSPGVGGVKLSSLVWGPLVVESGGAVYFPSETLISSIIPPSNPRKGCFTSKHHRNPMATTNSGARISSGEDLGILELKSLRWM